MEIIDKLAWIHIKEGKVLMTKSKGKEVWYFPGGKREAEETDEQALIREIKEEAGVDLILKTIEFVGKFETPAHGRPEGTMLQTTYYKADFIGEPKASGEIEEIGYFDNSLDPNLLTPMGILVFGWLKERGEIS